MPNGLIRSNDIGCVNRRALKSSCCVFRQTCRHSAPSWTVEAKQRGVMFFIPKMLRGSIKTWCFRVRRPLCYGVTSWLRNMYSTQPCHCRRSLSADLVIRLKNQFFQHFPMSYAVTGCLALQRQGGSGCDQVLSFFINIKRLSVPTGFN